VERGETFRRLVMEVAGTGIPTLEEPHTIPSKNKLLAHQQPQYLVVLTTDSDS